MIQHTKSYPTQLFTRDAPNPGHPLDELTRHVSSQLPPSYWVSNPPLLPLPTDYQNPHPLVQQQLNQRRQNSSFISQTLIGDVPSRQMPQQKSMLMFSANSNPGALMAASTQHQPYPFQTEAFTATSVPPPPPLHLPPPPPIDGRFHTRNEKTDDYRSFHQIDLSCDDLGCHGSVPPSLLINRSASGFVV